MKAPRLALLGLLAAVSSGCNYKPASSAVTNGSVTAADPIPTKTVEAPDALTTPDSLPEASKDETIDETRTKAEKGDAESQLKLGLRYYLGQGVRRDYGEAFKWFRKAADQGNAAGQALLGMCYQNGEGVPKDETEAAEWYRKAANGNPGQFLAALALTFRQAAEKGHQPCKWVLDLRTTTVLAFPKTTHSCQMVSQSCGSGRA